MNDSGASKPAPELHCPDCREPMRILAMLPASNGLSDLSFKCDRCGKVSGVVHKPED